MIIEAIKVVNDKKKAKLEEVDATEITCNVCGTELCEEGV